MNTVAVVGIGNILQGDDGIGVRAVRSLHADRSADQADLYDIGPAPFDILEALLEHERVIVVQALGAGRAPGTVVRTTVGDLDPLSAGVRAAHGLGLPDAVRVARELGACAEVVVLGVEPERIGWSVDLSRPVMAALPHLLDAVRRELSGTRMVAA